MTKNPKVTEYVVGSLIKATGIVPSDLKDTAVSAVKSKIASISLSKDAFLPTFNQSEQAFFLIQLS